MPTRKELMEQCKAHGLHGYSRKSKQELEAMLAAPPEPPTTPAAPNATPLTHEWFHIWFADCVGIPLHLRHQFKCLNVTITGPTATAHNDNPQGTTGPV